MNKLIWHLEDSKNLLERLQYVKKLKELLEIAKERLKWAHDEDIELETKFIGKLKDRISNYDVYQQKNLYKCNTCKELVEECLCSILDEI